MKFKSSAGGGAFIGNNTVIVSTEAIVSFGLTLDRLDFNVLLINNSVKVILNF